MANKTPGNRHRSALVPRWRWTRLLPFSPTFEGFPELGDTNCCRRPRSRQCSVELKKAAAISPA